MPDGTYGEYPAPRRLATSEIAEIVQQYHQAALNAIEAGMGLTSSYINLMIELIKTLHQNNVVQTIFSHAYDVDGLFVGLLLG